MGTKTNPSAFNCHAAAMPDEPIFTLLGRDPAAPSVIEAWCRQRTKMGKNDSIEDNARIDEAYDCALAMRKWREDNEDPMGDGVATWRLPRQQVDEEAEQPVAVEVDSFNGFNHLVEDMGCDCEASMSGNGPPHSPTCAMYVPPATERKIGKASELGMSYGKPIPHFRPDQSLTVPDEVPSHRFAHFHKGKRYAYAKGLEVSPIHLPVALDAMADSGWDLLAIFGETDSKNVGFIFKRNAEHDARIDIGRGLAL